MAKLIGVEIPDDLTTWIMCSSGEGHFKYASYEEAIADAKEQAQDTPDLVLGIYKLQHFVCARVQAPQLFDPPKEEAR